MRRVHAAGIGAAAVLIAAVATGFFIDWAPIAGDRLTRSISKTLDRSVTIAGSIRMHPTFSGLKGKASGIVIGNPAWARTDEFASIDSAEVTFSWLPLLIGRFEPNTIRIRGALFELESRPMEGGNQATWQIGPLDPGDEGRDGGVIHVRRLPDLILEDAALAVTDAYGQLHDIALQRFTLRRKGRGAIADALLGNQETPVKVNWAVNSLEALRSESAEMALTIESGTGSVTANGTLSLNPAIGFDLRSYWDLSALGVFGANLGMSGLPKGMPLKAKLRIAGSANAFAVHLEKVESGRSQVHGVLQGRLVQQGGVGSAYSLLELNGEVASQHLNVTSVLTLAGAGPNTGGRGKAAGASLVDFLFGPGLVVKLDVDVSALELAINDTVLKKATGRVMSDARLFRLSGLTARLGKGSVALDLVMDRAGTAVRDVALIFTAHDLDLGWLFDGLGTDPLLAAPTDFAGELRADGATTAEMLANLTGAVHFAAGRGALRGAAARGLALSGVKLPRQNGAKAFPLECLAGRVNFINGIAFVDGFTMRGAGYDVKGRGYADLGRQTIHMHFLPVAQELHTRPDIGDAIPYQVTGPVSRLRVNRAGEGSSENAAVPASVRKEVRIMSLPILRGEVARNNPCLASVREKHSVTRESGESPK